MMQSVHSSVVSAWRWRRSGEAIKRAERRAPGPKAMPGRQESWLYWRWDMLAAKKAKRPIREVVKHPARLG